MDDLVKRLRVDDPWCQPKCNNAADRIEALEAQLAKADALAEVAEEIATARYGIKACRVRAALTEYRAAREKE